jgi:hypothetical protein
MSGIELGNRRQVVQIENYESTRLNRETEISTCIAAFASLSTNPSGSLSDGP